jgi:nitric oxide reductase NorQ protein
MLIQAGRLTGRGIPLAEACDVTLVLPMTDDMDMREALTEAIAACV